MNILKKIIKKRLFGDKKLALKQFSEVELRTKTTPILMFELKQLVVVIVLLI